MSEKKITPAALNTSKIAMAIAIVCLLLCAKQSYCHAILSDTTVVKSGRQPVVDSSKQRDIADAYHTLFKKKSAAKRKPPKNASFSVVPTVGYTLSTGFTAGFSSLTTFFSGNDRKNSESVINLQAFYDSHSQQTFITQSNIFIDKDQFKFVTDLRVNRYPDVTYGLGNLTTTSTADNIAYNYIRYYQTIIKKLSPDFYAGGGYSLDYHYDITEQGTANNTVSAFDRYGKTSSSRSSGYNLNVLYDSRTNPVNSLGGGYINIFYRDNLKTFGSDEQWSSIQVDMRKYFRLPGSSNNVLAIWSYTWLTINGKQPYLDLPSVGNDTYNNTGRGYAIGRFRGKNMLYLETEYRYRITNNGLLGGVVFGSLESYPRSVTTQVKTLIPAAGSGLRIKVNKHTNTNLGIDYGVGTDGSHGVFVNLGEVF